MTRNEETIKEILELRESGLKIQEIADHYGVSRERIYQIAGDELKAWQKEHNPPKPKPKKDADIYDILKLIEKGKTVKEIAEMKNRSVSYVYNKMRDYEARTQTNLKNLRPMADIKGRGRGNVESLVDPETGYVVENRGQNAKIIGKMGDEKVTAFVRYHMDMLAMRQGVNKRDVSDLYARFINYLQYCEEHGVIPNNMNCYFAIGVSKDDITHWKTGKRGTADHQKFAEDLTSFFASIHEQGAIDNVLPIISAMFWQKAHDGLIEASKVEVVQDNPLGEKKSAEEIAKAYTDIDLPD